MTARVHTTDTEAMQWTEAYALVDSFEAYYAFATPIVAYANSMRAGIQYRVNVTLDFMR